MRELAEGEFLYKPKSAVLTGAPCGGKTSAMKYLLRKLPENDIVPLVAPEIATLLITGGVDIREIAKDPDLYVRIQKRFMQMQLSQEEVYTDIAHDLARARKRVIVLYDRGDRDIEAYNSPGDCAAIRQELNARRTERYDGVIHLVTAADGAEQFYTTANNQARKDSPEEARELDKKIKHAWTGHKNFTIIDNSTDFDTKLRRALEAIYGILGIPMPREIERKYLLRSEPDLSHPLLAHAAVYDIEQMYIPGMDGTGHMRIRKKIQGDAVGHYLTVKTDIPGMERSSDDAREQMEDEMGISPIEYQNLTRKRLPRARIIRKTRRCFLYDNRQWELDTFIEPTGKLTLLEVELLNRKIKVAPPPFLGAAEEVTNDKWYSNYRIACGSLDDFDR